MSRTNTWMPLYIGDYLADTMHLEAREHGAYLLLLMHYWRNGPLPDDDRALAGIARVDRKVWLADTGPIVRAFFTAEDGKLRQKRLDAERAEADENSAKKRDAARKRWDNKRDAIASDGDASGGADGDAYASDVDVQTTCPYAGALPSPSPSKKDTGPTGPDAKAASPDPVSASDLLWREGIPILMRLTGKSDGQCRGLLGRMRRDMQNDCPKLLLILQQARDMQPTDPVAWITAATQDRQRPAYQRRPTPSEAVAAAFGPSLYAGRFDLDAHLDAPREVSDARIRH